MKEGGSKSLHHIMTMEGTPKHLSGAFIVHPSAKDKKNCVEMKRGVCCGLHRQCVLNDECQCTCHHIPALQHTQINLDVLVILKEDEEGKLETLSSTSLLFW
eukprot:7196501-Ditylum_brightwellii.AAC.1